MKQLLLICAVVALVGGCASTPKVVPNSPEAKAAIEKAIREELEKPTGKLTKADLEKVTELGIYNKQLTSVKGLEKLTQLTKLDLNDNQLTDVKGLGKLTQLKTLTLSRNQLTDVKGLEKLTQLTELDLEDNQLTSVKGLENLKQLRKLNLEWNPNLTKAQINELQKALPNCRIGSNPPLIKEESAKVIEAAIRKELKKPTGELTKADYEKVTVLVHLYQNQLTDVKGLEKLTQLEELWLGQNQLTDVKGLEKLTKLTLLRLGWNQLADVKGLEKLTQLKELDLRYNPDLTKAQIDELQKALPKCQIQSNPTK
jgi:Leucine-rich repeat (LRR) protein